MKPAPGKEKRYWTMFLVHGAEQFVEVPKAYPVRIKGFEDMELFAYRAWLEGRDKGEWYVIESTSGYNVGAVSKRTKAQAVRAAEDTLVHRLGLEEVKRGIQSCIKTYGLSPRYLEGEEKDPNG
jgi:hypothetical protein